MDEGKQPEPVAEAPPDHYYNTVFEQLVSEAEPGEKQLVGLVAYGLYKLSKREWVLDHKSEHGAKPSDADHKAYAKSQTSIILDGYRSQATEIVATYASTVLENERPKIVTDALRGSFMRSFWPSLAAAVAFAAILSLIVIIAAINGFGLPIQIDMAPAQISN